MTIHKPAMHKPAIHIPALAATRFNRETWTENVEWRRLNNWNGCIYNSPIKIAEKVSLCIPIFVLEMHNDINEIQGIGLIKNAIDCQASASTKHRVYKDGNYNRYTYKSIYRIDRSELSTKEEKIIKIFDIILFKCSRHLNNRFHIIDFI